MKRINNWLSPKCEPRISRAHGKGIFAFKKIKDSKIHSKQNTKLIVFRKKELVRDV